jgi:hypothetical protein
VLKVELGLRDAFACTDDALDAPLPSGVDELGVFLPRLT